MYIRNAKETAEVDMNCMRKAVINLKKYSYKFK